MQRLDGIKFDNCARLVSICPKKDTGLKMLPEWLFDQFLIVPSCIRSCSWTATPINLFVGWIHCRELGKCMCVLLLFRNEGLACVVAFVR